MKQGNPEQIYEQIRAIHQDDVGAKEQIEKLERKLEDLLYNYDKGKEDYTNLSQALRNTLQVSIDLDSIKALQDKSTASVIDSDLSDQEFLDLERRRAETLLIKSRIAYKVNDDKVLSTAEQTYLSEWMKKSSEAGCLVPSAETMLPDSPSSLMLKALSPDDFYALNSIPKVDFDRKKHGEYALNDLVVEVTNFLDPDTVRKVELSVLEGNLKKEWKLSDGFGLVEKRNKEIDLTLKELEEIAWRLGSMLENKEFETIRNMLNAGRGLEKFDKIYHALDLDSLQEFFDEANNFDNRVTLLENWICRKEEEIKTRVNLPTPDLQKSDATLYAKIDKKLKKARESIASKMLTTDQFGNEQPSKKYSDLTTAELHMLVESISVRLNLFNNKYPAFIPHVVKAIMEHENLANSDRSTLQTYCTLFELDWMGDKVLENREELLMTNPVYMHGKHMSNVVDIGSIENDRVEKMIKQASQPFLPNLAKKMQEQAGAPTTPKPKQSFMQGAKPKGKPAEEMI